jgi:hypothetical protein
MKPFALFVLLGSFYLGKAAPQEGISLLEDAHFHLSAAHPDAYPSLLEDKFPSISEHHRKLGQLHRKRSKLLRKLRKHHRKMAQHIRHGRQLAVSDALRGHKKQLAKRIRLRSLKLAAKMKRLERQLERDTDASIASQHRAQLATLRRHLERLHRHHLKRQHEHFKKHLKVRLGATHGAMRRLIRLYRRKLSLELEKHRQRLTRKWKKHLERYHSSNESQKAKLRRLRTQRAAILKEMRRQQRISRQALEAYKQKMRRKWRKYQAKDSQVKHELSEKVQDAKMGQLYWKKKSQKHKENSQLWKKQHKKTKKQLIQVVKKGLAEKGNADYWRRKAAARKFLSRYWKDQVKMERREREMLEKMMNGDYDDHLTVKDRNELRRNRQFHWDRIEKYMSLIKEPRDGSLDSSMDKLRQEVKALTLLFRKFYQGALRRPDLE